MAIIRKGSFVEREKKTLQRNNISSHIGAVNQGQTVDVFNQSPVLGYEEGLRNLQSSTSDSSGGYSSFNNSSLNAEKVKIEQDILILKQRATEEISEMKHEALQDIEELRSRAKEDAYADGKREVLSQYEDNFAELGNAIKTLLDDKKKLIRESEGELLKLSIKIAEQIIRSEISLNQGIALNIVSEAVTKITDRDKVIVKVSRSDFDFVQKNKDRMMALMDDLSNLIIQEDPSIEPGGCLIETDLGYVDSRVSVKLESIKTALMKQFADNVAAGVEPDLKPFLSPAKGDLNVGASNKINKKSASDIGNSVYNHIVTDDDELDDDIFNFDDDDDDLFQ